MSPAFTLIGRGKKHCMKDQLHPNSRSLVLAKKTKKKLHELRLVISPPFDDKSAILIANLLSFRQPPGPGLIDRQNNKKKVHETAVLWAIIPLPFDHKGRVFSPNPLDRR